MLFGRRNYAFLLAGIAVMALGYALMSGGSQPPDQWNEEVIYGFRRITLSTILVAAGLVLVLLSIFAKGKHSD
ncbi:MAG: DUF3098 domain-containing protein [Chitinophagales bacterium]|nr:DUF3098 domain-containing protein [Chitinophagales bacterium]MDW8392988.1 DUF3098 domain-containing protein [Chitinophagales bacterium]